MLFIGGLVVNGMKQKTQGGLYSWRGVKRACGGPCLSVEEQRGDVVTLARSLHLALEVLVLRVSPKGLSPRATCPPLFQNYEAFNVIPRA